LHSASFDLRPFELEYHEVEKSIWCKLNFVGLLTQRNINLPNFNLFKELIWERYDFSKTTYKFYHIQVLWRNKSNLLKCRLFTLQRTIYIFFGRVKMDWRNVGIRISYQIKRKRERKWWGSQKEEENSTFSPIPEIMFSYILFISFSIDMQG